MEAVHVFPTALCDRLVRAGAIAVLVIDNVDHAVRTAQALWQGGVEIADDARGCVGEDRVARGRNEQRRESGRR